MCQPPYANRPATMARRKSLKDAGGAVPSGWTGCTEPAAARSSPPATMIAMAAIFATVSTVWTRLPALTPT